MFNRRALAAGIGLVLQVACGGAARSRPVSAEATTPTSTTPVPTLRLPAVMTPAGGAGATLAVQLHRWRDIDHGAAPAMPGPPPALELLRLEAEVGNYAEALRQSDRMHEPWKPGTNEPPYPGAGWTAEDALESITAAAAGSRIVMINEAHHVPMHRAFTTRLLRRLHDAGFTYLAVESLYDTDTLLAARGYPIRASGAYLPEPVYGDLVRTALRLGFHVVPYESSGSSLPGKREEGQARNLLRRTLDVNSNARILVHAGYDHINKAGLLAGVPPMAMVVRRLTGIEPLSIDQTEMTEHSAPDFENPFYRRAVFEGRVTRATVFRNANGSRWTFEPGTRDITVFHPRTQLDQGRPTWLRMGGLRAPQPLAPNICGAATHCLVDARLASETDDAVPLDQVEVTAGATPALMLPADDFWITARGEDGAVISRTRLRVAPW